MRRFTTSILAGSIVLGSLGVLGAAAAGPAGAEPVPTSMRTDDCDLWRTAIVKQRLWGAYYLMIGDTEAAQRKFDSANIIESNISVRCGTGTSSAT